MAKKKYLKKLAEGPLRKKWADSDIASNIVLAEEDMLWLPSRFLAFNYQLGGGIPYGKILELYGEESSGKSLLALDFAYCCQRLGGQVLWADSEHSFTRSWSLLNGIELDRVELFREKAIERIADWSIDMLLYYRSILTNNEPILMVVDSIAALDCLANLNSEHVSDKADMGNRAKAMDKMLRTRNGRWEELGMSVILINQLRSNLKASKFQDPDTTPGGKATRYYASQRIGVYGGRQIKEKINDKERRVGVHTSIRVKKNKVAPPRQTIKAAPVYFHPECKHGIGFDKYFGLPDVLLERGIIKRKKGASRFYYRGAVLANGEDNLMELLIDDNKLRAKLIRKAGINTISATRKKIDKIEGNLFKVKQFKKEKDEETE